MHQKQLSLSLSFPSLLLSSSIKTICCILFLAWLLYPTITFCVCACVSLNVCIAEETYCTCLSNQCAEPRLIPCKITHLLFEQHTKSSPASGPLVDQTFPPLFVPPPSLLIYALFHLTFISFLSLAVQEQQEVLMVHHNKDLCFSLSFYKCAVLYGETLQTGLNVKLSPSLYGRK